jgi:hypothetical protein
MTHDELNAWVEGGDAPEWLTKAFFALRDRLETEPRQLTEEEMLRILEARTHRSFVFDPERDGPTEFLPPVSLSKTNANTSLE